MQTGTLKWCHGCWSHRYTYSGMYLFAYHTLMLTKTKQNQTKQKKQNKTKQNKTKKNVFVEVKTSINADKNKH